MFHPDNSNLTIRITPFHAERDGVPEPIELYRYPPNHETFIRSIWTVLNKNKTECEQALNILKTIRAGEQVGS